MKKLFFLMLATSLMTLVASAQLTIPRESTKQEITQLVGDAKISISYFRPNSKGRVLWGCTSTDVIPKGGVTYPCLVPNGQVWRTGANDATVFETTTDLMINGQKLPKGKYALFSIPDKDEWTIIFNKTWNQWGSFNYDVKEDALRIKAKPEAGGMFETMTITIDDVTATAAKVAIRWEKIAVPFTVDVGDMNGRLVGDMRRRMTTEPVQLANYVLGQKMTAAFPEVLTWLEASIKTRETFGNLSAKARVLAEMGRVAEAIEAGERAVAVGKTQTPPANTAAFEKTLAEWKNKK
ncbi:MAG: DUF2911 domain-containing protein [Acidobacteria bacterium]|nr:DUF2911 domain-containing protein [Acidobacteriota bacterium]